MAPIVKESLPAPLVIERLVTCASGRLVVTPSTVTETSVVSATTEIVCADASREIVHVAGDGGEGPLPGTAAGSSEGSVALVGVAIVVAATVLRSEAAERERQAAAEPAYAESA